MSSSGVRAVGEKTCSSTIGPASLESTCLKVTSFGTFTVNTTVEASGTSTLTRFASSEEGPFGSLIFTWRSKLNLTSDEVRSWPFAHFKPGLSLTVNSVGDEKSPDSAMLGATSGLPTGLSNRNGYTWSWTASEPLSYDPAGSRVTSGSVVPTMIVPPDLPPDEELPPPPLAEQPARISAAAERPAVATNARRNRPGNADVISVYLFHRSVPARRRARAVKPHRGAVRHRSSTMAGPHPVRRTIRYSAETSAAEAVSPRAGSGAPPRG